MKRSSIFFGCALLGGLILHIPSYVCAEDTSDVEEHFEKSVRPLLIERCSECHSGETPDGDLNLDAREGFLAGGVSGELIDASNTGKSLLLERIMTADEDTMMPPDEPLSQQEIAAIKTWIEAGAAWPESAYSIHADSNAASNKDSDLHWSFVPVTRPEVPVEQSDPWCWNPVDAFLMHQMKSVGLLPVEEASPQTWLRRLSLDLTGLPPSLEQLSRLRQAQNEGELRSFAQQEIETLLASRSYAERQARRWLDLARYADTSGDGTDTPIPEARYYRDWVIDAFDQDMPYDQFIIEQIAGDLLAEQSPESPEAFRQVIATGFIALSRRFGNSKFADMHQIIDDTIDTIGKSTMGLSLGCARCHHHKFDPVTTEDYYGLYGYFESTQYPHAGTEHQKERSDMPAIQVPESLNTTYESSVAWAVNDKPKVQDSKVLIGGDPHRKGEVAVRGFLGFLGELNEEIPLEQSGRLQLAQRIASRDNPLFARVMANRVWQSHFGGGIVTNANNFGIQTAQPVHADLLDYLASELIDSGWSIKHLHRIILSSHVYRLASQASPAAIQIDEANRYFARFPRVRMDAETIRDAMLFVSGQLQEGSNGRHPFKPTTKLKYTQGRPFDEIFDHKHRSIYLMTPRLNKHPMLAMFDGADANKTTGKRSETTVPLQSLFLVNGQFAADQATAFAKRAMQLSPSTDQRIELLWQLALARAPSRTEMRMVQDHVSVAMRDLLAEGHENGEAERLAWKGVARILFASNEFIYID